MTCQQNFGILKRNKTLAEINIDKLQARIKLSNRLIEGSKNGQINIKDIRDEIEKEYGVKISQNLPKVNVKDELEEIKSQLFRKELKEGELFIESKHVYLIFNYRLCYMPPKNQSHLKKLPKYFKF